MSENSSRVAYIKILLQPRDRSTLPPSGETMNMSSWDMIDYKIFAMLMNHITSSGSVLIFRYLCFELWIEGFVILASILLGYEALGSAVNVLVLFFRCQRSKPSACWSKSCLITGSGTFSSRTLRICIASSSNSRDSCRCVYVALAFSECTPQQWSLLFLRFSLLFFPFNIFLYILLLLTYFITPHTFFYFSISPCHILICYPSFLSLLLSFYLQQEYIPDLYNHFLNVGLEAHMYASQWFLTLFTAKFPLYMVFHIIDLLLCEVGNTTTLLSLCCRYKLKFQLV